MLTIEHPGLLCSLQDAGRPGYARLGIGRSGAADLPALQLANALVGNPPHSAALEMTLQGATLVFSRQSSFALTGAPLPHARLNGVPITSWAPIQAPAGSRLECGGMPSGCRAYLAIAGGFDLPDWLGSQATDLNAALGPLPGKLQAGDQLPLGQPTRAFRAAAHWQLAPGYWFRNHPQPLRLLPGSHSHLLDEDSRNALSQQAFRISPDSNRTGIRLQGPSLHLQQPLEMLSSGLTSGVMQLPPGGQPILMGPEHPVTGGYPRIAQLAAVDLPQLAQCRPGDTVRFAWITLKQALQLQQRQQQALQQLIQQIQHRLTSA